MKFKNKQNEFIVTEGRILFALGVVMCWYDWEAQSCRKLSRVMEIFYISIWLVIIWMYTCVKTHGDAQLRFVYFIVSRLQLKNKNPEQKTVALSGHSSRIQVG